MTDTQLWKAALGQLELRVSQGNFLTWFRDTKIKERRERTILIETPSPFAHEWLSKKYQGTILEILQDLDENIDQVEFCIHTTSPIHRPLKKNSRIVAHKVRPQPTAAVAVAPAQLNVTPAPRSDTNITLNPKYTFDSFIVGPSNEIAYAACRAVADRPGVVYNPLFIYGGVGLGKTHLLQSVGNALIASNPLFRILYVSSEKFINEFVQSIQEQKTHQFKKQYREVDVLIIDDVQFIAGKGKTQEELFHTFNALHSQNKQVILSSDRPPVAIPTLEERLSSRLSGGMIVDIKLPDYETRLAILTEKTQQRPVQVDDEALAFIAKNVQKNVRELEGALNRVLGHAEFNKQRVTLEFTKKLLEDVLQQPQVKTVDVGKVLEAVSLYYNISLDDLCGKCRKQEIVRPRQVAMYLLRQENNISFPSIGGYFGGRDHTTAMHACEKITKLLEHDTDLSQEINFIRERLYA
jgi:chromosomal replication initiator protein